VTEAPGMTPGATLEVSQGMESAIHRVAVRCYHAALRRALEVVGAAVSSSAFPRSLRGVLISAHNDQLTLTTSSGEKSFVSTRLPESLSGARKILVDHRDLSAAVAALTKGSGHAIDPTQLAVELAGPGPLDLAVPVRGRTVRDRHLAPQKAGDR
jgi:hypothetical protein